MNRTLLKTCTYGVMHFTVAIAVAYALTRNWQLALAVGIVEPLVQTFAFALHERLWSRAGASPAPRAGAGTAWCPTRSRCGRAGPTASMTASSTPAPATPGASSA